jgi:hypothetical protein
VNTGKLLDHGPNEAMTAQWRLGNLRKRDCSNKGLVNMRLDWHPTSDPAEIMAGKLKCDLGVAFIKIERCVSISVRMLEEICCADERMDQLPESGIRPLSMLPDNLRDGRN